MHFAVTEHSHYFINSTINDVASYGVINIIINFIRDFVSNEIRDALPVRDVSQSATNKFTAAIIHLQ